MCSGSTIAPQPLLLFGIGLGDVGRYRVHIGLRLLDGDARLQAAHREQPVEIVIELLGLERQRDYQPGVKAVSLARSEYTDNGIGGAIDLDGLADDVGIGAQTLP